MSISSLQGDFFDQTMILLPTYNERQNLSQLIPQVYRQLPGCHVLVIDDGSPDGTAELVQSLIDGQYSGQLFLMNRGEKLGLGTAYIAGFKWALARSYQFVLQMDADFSHAPKYLPELYKVALDGADLVLGSRYVPGGGVENWPLTRRLISRFGSVYARFWLKLPVQDVTGGFKFFKRAVLESLKLDEVKSNGYSFQIEITYITWRLGFKIKEVPIIFADRVDGESKMSRAIAIEAMRRVPKLKGEFGKYYCN